MDDTQTQPNRTSDAAAVRKRRSSILKSQRPPRTPFSELEFNVATPTDTTKSRRVSFSRRTGVAEFATNEATTTWKNFYEEHNKSLESSGNDSEVNGARKPIGHIGKSIFDQQFEEVEAIDFIGSLQKPSGLNINTSLNNDNFTQQLASLECTGDDRKLFVPPTNFELSNLTDHQSKLFGDDLTVQCNGEVSDRIDINFSSVQQICEEKDDLDEIQEDLKRSQSSFAYQATNSNRRDTLDYIEMDLNMTRVTVRNDESDMSITETVQSPKVQNVSHTFSVDKKANTNNDWLADKENIAVNPYVTPRESANFAINEEPDKVLVFDGKRLTIQTDKGDADLDMIRNNRRQTVLRKKSIEQLPHGNPVGCDLNADLAHVVDGEQYVSKNEMVAGLIGIEELQRTITYNEVDMSMTRPLASAGALLSKQTIIYDDNLGDISITQAIPTHIIKPDEENGNPDENRTFVHRNDTGNISITKCLPANIIEPQQADRNTDRRRTVVFENDTGNISVTQAVPSNIILRNNKIISDKRKTILYENETGDISITQALPANIIIPERGDNNPERRRTIVYEDDTGNVSITRTVPANILLPKKDQIPAKKRTIVNNDFTGNISVTETVPAIKDIPRKTERSEKRRTIVYENETGNISITQAVQANIILRDMINVACDANTEDISMTQAVPSNILLTEAKMPHRRRTVVYENDTGNLSITQAVTLTRLIPGYVDKQEDALKSNDGNISIKTEDHNEMVANTGTMLYENLAADISMTEVIPGNIVSSDNKSSDKSRTIVFEDEGNISMTQALPANILIEKQDYIQTDISGTDEVANGKQSIFFGNIIQENKRQTIGFDREDDVDMSINNIQDIIKKTENRKTLLFKSDLVNLSKTKPISDEMLHINNEVVDKCDTKNDLNFTHNASYQGQASNISDVLVYQAAALNSTNKLLTKTTEKGDSDYKKLMDSNSYGKYQISSPTKIVENVVEIKTINDEVQKQASKDNQLSEDEDNEQPKYSQTETFVARSFSTDRTKVSNIAESKVYEEQNPANSNESCNVDSENCKRQSAKLIKIKEPSNSESQVYEEPNIISEKYTEAHLEQKHSTESNISDCKKYVAVLTSKVSVLDDLLNMSSTSTESSMTKTVSESPEEAKVTPDTDSSNDSLFYITRDSEEEPQTDKTSTTRSRTSVKFVDELPLINEESPLLIEIEDENEPDVVIDLENILDEVKTITIKEGKSPPQNRYYEKVLSSDLDGTVKQENSINKSYNKETIDTSKCSKKIKSADDTNELLEMLSDFTDKPSFNLEKDDKIPEPIMIKGHVALEIKSENREPKRLSFAPNRQSIILSREDLLNNISMAQAALQKSKLELDECDDVDDTETNTPLEQSALPKRSFRMSNEVVKTLHFEDESLSDTSLRRDNKVSTLKKAALGDATHVKESKAHVIPTYLKDVSDGMKQLMQDLVKPMVDVTPLDLGKIDKGLKNIPSTCSTQIQANLITSSQIDVTTELYSNAESLSETCNSNSSIGTCNNAVKPASGESAFEELLQRRPPIDQTIPGKVIVFDHNNPLNNIVLTPTDVSEAHKYNPGESTETLCVSERSHSAQISFSEKDDPERVSTLYNVENRVVPSVYQSGDACSEKMAAAQSVTSHSSKPMSIDQSTDVLTVDVTDNEVNTVIAMKGNKDLLEASSSLTLVDEALAHSALDVFIDTHTPSRESTKVIYKVEEHEGSLSDKLDSDFISDESPEPHVAPVHVKIEPKKRVYSPSKPDGHKNCTFSKLDVTPKPITKMARLSHSPTHSKHNTSPVKYNATEDHTTSGANATPKSATKMQKLPDSSTRLKRRSSSEKHKATAEQSNISRTDSSPKPVTKVQRLSRSSTQLKCRKPFEKHKKVTPKKNDTSVTEVSTDSHQSVEHNQKSGQTKFNHAKSSESKKRSRSKKPGTNITVQHLLAEYHRSDIDQIPLKGILKNMRSDCSSVEPNSQSDMQDSQSLDVFSSFTSSKYLNEMQDDRGHVSGPHAVSDVKSKASHVYWRPGTSEHSTKSVSDCDSSVNVVAKIDMLPFIGSRECEWESSCGDVWSFRLMRARLRLSVRLAHRLDNAPRTRVGADTPVLGFWLETVHQDKNNPVARMCVGFAAETMRYYTGRGCARAGAVPALLRRCVAAARLALRWGRAMHEARLRLAYTLTRDGCLSLKVANIPLRSVWEVTMQVELLVDEAREAPWPRASSVRVSRIVSDVAVCDAEVRRVLDNIAQDWGHVPRTVWRIFKYLKNKTAVYNVLLRK